MEKANRHKWFILTILATSAIVAFLVVTNRREVIPEANIVSHPSVTVPSIDISKDPEVNKKTKQDSNEDTSALTSDQCPPNREVLPTQSTSPNLQATRYPDHLAPPGAALGISFEEDVQLVTYPPHDLRATRLLDGSIKCEWSHDGMALNSFNVYRREGSNDWIKIGSVDKNSTHMYSFIDSLAHKDRVYLYSVSIVNVLDNESSCSQRIVVPVL